MSRNSFSLSPHALQGPISESNLAVTALFTLNTSTVVELRQTTSTALPFLLMLLVVSYVRQANVT